jgi:pyrrolysine biosynthesis protein PylD
VVTRLKPGDVAGLDRGLELYDEELRAKTGRTLRQIACRAEGIEEERILGAIQNTTVGVISMTAGEGVISGFAQAVRSIIGHLGFKAVVPDRVDVAGLAVAVEAGADILFMADDLRFVALNLATRRIVDNSEATGRGYGAALEGLAQGLRGRRVFLIGAGQVGTGAARILREMGAQIGVFDRKTERAEGLARQVGGVVEGDLERAIHEYTILVDACPAGEFIKASHIKPTTFVAAPGIPLGLTTEARSRVGHRLIHDPLQIGVATMMISALV